MERRDTGMNTKRLTAMIMLAMIAITLIFTFAQAAYKKKKFPVFNQYYGIEEYLKQVESFFAENLPFSDALQSLSVDLQMMGGETQYNDIFIGNDILVENIGYPNEQVTAKNMETLLSFLNRTKISTNFMLIPTKCAIKQNEIDKDAPLFNQKSFIEETYNQILGKATAVNVYPVLFSNMNQYIYYRTDPNLTSLGAYYVYSVLLERLGVYHNQRMQEDFMIQHVSNHFQGKTYDRLRYKNITPDVISIYQYQRNGRVYTVTHDKDYEYTYNTLYPTQLLELGYELDVFLGGDSGDVTVRSNSKSGQSLLIVGDESILPVIPFLMAHYNLIRYVDLSKWQADEIEEIELEDYKQMLIAYSVDTFIHSGNPSRLERVATD